MKVIMTLIVEYKGELKLGKRIGRLASIESVAPIGKGERYALIMTSSSLEDSEKAIRTLSRKLPAARITKQTTQYFSG